MIDPHYGYAEIVPEWAWLYVNGQGVSSFT